MSIRDIRGPEVIDNTVEMQSGASYTITNEAVLIVNKTTGSNTAVSLPKSPRNGQLVRIKDGKGDAGTHNITVTDPASNTIDGAASFVINANYGRVALLWDQSPSPNTAEWKVIDNA